MKSGTLNLLEPSGPVQTCNGIAFTNPDLIELLDPEHGGTILPRNVVNNLAFDTAFHMPEYLKRRC
jgi:hypothetical protein